MPKQNYPILEFDPNPKAIFGPEDIYKEKEISDAYNIYGLDDSHRNLVFTVSNEVGNINLDEYLGISIDLEKPYEMDQSYARFMYEELFSRINIKQENINVPYGLAENPDQFCRQYEEKIKSLGGIDMQILGIGGDGHWGFNEPGSSFDSRTRVEKLNPKTIDDNYEAFYKKAGVSKEEMPRYALTMGIGTILETKSALMLVNGEKKADIIQKALEGPLSTEVTASAIQIYKGDATVILDKAAASKLKNI